MKNGRKIFSVLLVAFALLVSIINVYAVRIISQDSTYGFTIVQELETLDNGTVARKWISGDYNDAQKKELTKYVMDNYDIIQELYAGQPTVKYNCHSYAWFSQEINNLYWIDDPQKFREGNWLKSTGWTDTMPSGIKIGDVVDYYISENNRPHSALVSSVLLNWVSSKWGSLGLYMHTLTEVPAGYKCDQFGYYRMK